MTEPVRVRMYNVGFGDCFVVSIPGPERDHVVLVDCGRHSGTLMDEPPFWDVVERVVADLPRVDGKPTVDVLVMTHRHRDHVHGFSREELWRDVRVGEVWMPWTENDADPVARGLKEQQDASAARSFHALRAFGAGARPAVDIALNSITNQGAMDTLRGFGCPVRYLPDPLRPQGTVLTGRAGGGLGLPAGVTVHVLGPSRDRATITLLDPPPGSAYLRMVPATTLDVAFDAAAPYDSPPLDVPRPWAGDWDISRPEYEARVGAGGAPLVDDDLLAHLDAAACADAEGLAMSVDHALNGTSLVLLFEIGKLCLLFPGDAQWGTWKAMLANPDWEQKLKDVRFLKVGHHGSHNATPVEFVEGYLHDAVAMLSVSATAYETKGWKEIPKDELVEAMQAAGRLDLLVRSDKPAPRSPRVTSDPGGFWTEVRLDVDGEP
ncbi:MAG: hypothetical protein QOG82_2043 [Actinomycetota bacterium]|jgi:beta-lactamase superfamily II metal-dependent hydrolase|nr:hypothetical protein [Actinomycetota bacterium]